MIWLVVYLWVAGWWMASAMVRSELDRGGIKPNEAIRAFLGFSAWPIVAALLTIVMIAKAFNFVIWDKDRGWVFRWEK